MDAVGVAAAALQFGVTLFQATQTLDAVLKGKSSEPVVTMKMLAKLAEGECDAFLRNYSTDCTPAVRDARIIAQQGKDVCGALLKKIAKMHPEKKNPKTVVWSLGAIVWSKDELVELQRGLSHCMQALGRFLSQQDRAAVDAALKEAEKSLASQIEEKSDQILALHMKTSAQADDRWSQVIQLANAEYAKRSTQKKVKLLLDALAFPGMGERYSVVSTADDSTFDWIFKKHENSAMEDRLARWLTSGNGVFHIAGKPGSGKSTLMKYLFEKPTTTQMLEQWAAGRTLVQAACFFWKPGSVLEKTMMGLVRTLLHGMIVDSHEVAEILFPEVWAAAVEEKVEISLSDAAMQDAFQRLVDGNTRLADAGFCYCFFIDGLDEYGDANSTIIRLVRQLTRMAQNGSGWLKICASSREYPEITEKLAADEAHHLTLQDLTRGDITALVDQRLQRTFPDGEFFDNIFDNEELNKLRDAIIQHAEGVFLWVVLVLGIIDEEAELGTPVCELQDFVEVQHDDLDAFFETVVARIEKRNRRKAAVLFQYTLLSQRTSNSKGIFYKKKAVFPGSLIWYIFLLEYPAVDSSVAEEDFLARCKATQQLLHTSVALNARLHDTLKRVERCSEGLLTMPRSQDSGVDQLATAQVGLTHRSIHEFLSNLLATRWKDAIADFDAPGALVRMMLPVQWPVGYGINHLLATLFRMLVVAGPDRIDTDRLHRTFELADAYEALVDKSIPPAPGKSLAISTATVNCCYEYLDWRRRTPDARFEKHQWVRQLCVAVSRYLFWLDETKQWLSTVQLLAEGLSVSAIGDYNETPWRAVTWLLDSWDSRHPNPWLTRRHPNPRFTRSRPNPRLPCGMVLGLLEIFIQKSDEVDGTLPMWVWLDKESLFVEIKGHLLDDSSVVKRAAWKTDPTEIETPVPTDEAMPVTESLAERMAKLGLADKLVALAEAREPAAARARRAEQLLSAESIERLRKLDDENHFVSW